MWHLISSVLKSLFDILFSYFAWILPYSKKLDKIPLTKRYEKVRKLVMRVNKNLKLDIHVEGKDNIPEGCCCFIANHLAVTDPLLLFPIMEKPLSFLGKIEIQKYPFAGRCLTVGGGLFLERDNLKQQLKIMMKVQDSLRNQESSWMIFPEGTRRKDQMMNIAEFHHGTFRAPMKAQVPIVPVVQYGTFRLLDTKHSLKKYPTIIKFLKPIYPEEYEGKSTEEVAKMVQSIIQKNLTFYARRFNHEQMLQLEDKNYRFNRLY